MSKEQIHSKSKFPRSNRINALLTRFYELAESGKLRVSGGGEPTAIIDIGPFPKKEQLPSQVQGYRASAQQFAEDFAFLLDAMEPAIHANERIVGEVYWELDEERPLIYDNAEEVDRKMEEAAELGAYPQSRNHNCPDMAIILKDGYDGILARIRKSKQMYTELGNERRAGYLRGLEQVCLACIRYIERYAKEAERLAASAETAEEKERLQKISECCSHIAHKAPTSFYEAVQSVTFAILLDRVAVGSGNGYGRADQFFYEFYKNDIQKGILTREDAREYVAEMYMKEPINFFGLGGRLEDGSDATNEMSWVLLEAYDMLGIDNNLSAMWHSDIDPAFYDYACDVLARYGSCIPVLTNWDVMHQMELRSGVPAKDAWKVSYSGCQWFALPGLEYCGHDTNTVEVLTLMIRILPECAKEGVTDFETLYARFEQELHRSFKALQAAEAAMDLVRPGGKPEMFASMLSHGPIERGLDITAPRAVDYQYTDVNILGIPNVTDSFVALKNLVFDKKEYTLQEVVKACQEDWAGNEIMRQKFLNQPKYGNGITEVDEMYVRICNSVSEVAESFVNQRGGLPYRPCLYCYMAHMRQSDEATPDGRHKNDPFAHGINPQMGASTKGLLPLLNSSSAVDMRKYAGGPIHVDLQPKFFDGKEEHYSYIRDLSVGYFKSGGIQMNLHILDRKMLEDAIEHPEKPEYRQLTVRVTGYSARFVVLPRDYQEEFVARVNFEKV